MRSLMMRCLARAATPLFVQRVLEYNVSTSHALMGVGSTGSLASVADIEVLKRFAREARNTTHNLTVFDVGANIGQYATLIRNALHSHKYFVHSFEPAQGTFNRLREMLGNDQRHVLNNMGLGQKEGTLTLYSDSIDSGCASLTRPQYGRDFNLRQEVKITTLDRYCENQNIDLIDWLKIDVEGHELDVLKGGVRMFRLNKIRNVYFEFGFPAIESRTFLRDYFLFFTEFGLDLYRVTMGGTFVPINQYRGSLEQFRGSSTFLAKRRDQ